MPDFTTPPQYDPALQGVWRVNWKRVNGQPPRRGDCLHIFGNYLLIQTHTHAFPVDYTVSLDTTPKRMSLFNQVLKSKQKAIYQIDGNKLLLCSTSIFLNADDLDFPSSFHTVMDDQLDVAELERLPVALRDLSIDGLPELVNQYCGPAKEPPTDADIDALNATWAKRCEIAEEKIRLAAISVSDCCEHDYPVAYHKEMTESDRIPFAVFWLIAEVNNGGFEQYLYNGTGAIAPDTKIQLEKIGATYTAGLLAKALSFFPDSTPAADDTTRRSQLEALTLEQHEALSVLDDCFYASEEDINALAVQYLRL